jgi:hypothetical protein
MMMKSPPHTPVKVRLSTVDKGKFTVLIIMSDCHVDAGADETTEDLKGASRMTGDDTHNYLLL